MRSCRQRGFQDAMFIRLFRLWSIARDDAAPALPAMFEEAAKLGYKDQTAAACASLFELVEAHLGRQLVRECCCSPKFSPDERALIGVLRTAPTLEVGRGTREVPHGMPGAISWAASCVCDAMGVTLDDSVVRLVRTPANSQDCPFSTSERSERSYGV